MHKSGFLLIAIIFISLISCDSNRVYDEYESLPRVWNKDSIITFKVSNIDTLENYNLFINIRNNSEFKYSNLFLITQIQFPHGKVVSDTLEYTMTTPAGEWLGTGFGEVKENKLWFKEKVKFEEAGDYEIQIKHAMRKRGEEQGLENLEGITDIGFRIENILK